MEDFQFKFNKDLIERNNYDIHKICGEAIHYCFKKVDYKLQENKQKIQSFFQDIIQQIEGFQQEFNDKTNLDVQHKIFQIIFLFCINIFKFHLTVQQLSITYSVIPVLEIGYQGMKNPDKNRIDILLKEIFQFFKDQQNLNAYDKKDEHCALLIAAYYNIQQQKYNPSLQILEQLEKIYRKQDEEVIEKRIKQDGEQQQQQQQQIPKKQQIFRVGFYESIITFKALNYVFQNQIKKLEPEIKSLENILSENNDNIQLERMKQRLFQYINLFKTHQYFMQKQFDLAKQTLNNLNFIQIEEALLLFFNNQNIQCIRNLETIYYNLFSDSFFKIFTCLQELERKQITSMEIEEINKIYQETDKKHLAYQYGRGILLLFMVICSRLLRIGKKYKESQEMMVKMFQTCQKSQIQFQDSLLIFFKYDLLISYLYEKVGYKKENVYTIINQKIHKTNLSHIDLAIKDGVEFILKTINLESESSKMSKFDILNEIAIQMLVSHRNILKVYDLYQNSDGNIVLVQKRQGNNLRQHLKENGSSIDQIQRYSYILQIINVFQYLHNLNIIHCDLKLDNILVQLQNDKKIKLIDFGFSQIKLFNKYFKPIGTTFYLAPSELKKNNQLCTFESEIYMIAKTIIEILDLEKESFENPKYLISEQFQQLLQNMTLKKAEERCVMSDVLQTFKLDFFILKIYNEPTKTEKKKQQCYKIFSKNMLNLYNQFITDKYMISLSNSLKADQSEQNKQNIFDEQIQKEICESIKSLMKQEDEDFITCLQDNDIKLFSESLYRMASNQSDLDIIDFEKPIQNITKKQKQDDTNSKNDILNEYQKDIIDKTNYDMNQANEEQDIKTQLQNQWKNVYDKMEQIIKGLQIEYRGQVSSDITQFQIYETQQFCESYKIEVLAQGYYSGQVSVQQLSQLSYVPNQNQYNHLENQIYSQGSYQLMQVSRNSQNDLNNNDVNVQSYVLQEYSQLSSQNQNDQFQETSQRNEDLYDQRQQEQSESEKQISQEDEDSNNQILLEYS